jgi:UV radiation resistance-associated gene protein
VRNLSITSAPSRRHRRTIADEDVEYSSKTPIKLLAQSEAHSLHQTRSFSNLKSSEKNVSVVVPKETSKQHENSSQTKGRPRFGQIRRRSTLLWTGASPETRQSKLENVARERMADTWFSLHNADVLEPVYISEVVEKSTNPTFRFFDLNTSGPPVARANEIKLKLWAKTKQIGNYVLLVELEICLRSLQFIGKSLYNFRQPLPLNCILFHFEDGIYTSFTDMPSHEQLRTPNSQPASRAGVTKLDWTSSYNSLMQLANVDDCIQDALATRAKLEEQISALLSRSSEGLDMLDRKRKAQEALNDVNSAVCSEQRQVRLLTRRRDEIVASIQLRKDAIESGRSTQSKKHALVRSLQIALHETQIQCRKTLEKSSAQVRRVCEDLEMIYPLEPVKNRPLHFSIRNLYLPNSVFDDTNRDEIAAALGFTSMLIHMISLYLLTPLPYPIVPNASTSTIEDPISAAITQRTFPLHPTNVSYKFEYGVFLLNKDIEFLMNKNGLRILDIRHTLPNLKYLLYVLSAGTGELPARKAGGIRGLGTGRLSPLLSSRRGSEESIHSSVGFRLPEGDRRHGNLSVQVNGKHRDIMRDGEREAEAAMVKVKAEVESDNSARVYPAACGKIAAYRSSALREQVNT